MSDEADQLKWLREKNIELNAEIERLKDSITRWNKLVDQYAIRERELNTKLVDLKAMCRNIFEIIAKAKML